MNAMNSGFLAHSSGPDEGIDAAGTERRPRFEMA